MCFRKSDRKPDHGYIHPKPAQPDGTVTEDNPTDAFRFAMAFEEDVSKQKNYEGAAIKKRTSNRHKGK